MSIEICVVDLHGAWWTCLIIVQPRYVLHLTACDSSSLMRPHVLRSNSCVLNKYLGDMGVELDNSLPTFSSVDNWYQYPSWYGYLFNRENNTMSASGIHEFNWDLRQWQVVDITTEVCVVRYCLWLLIAQECTCTAVASLELWVSNKRLDNVVLDDLLLMLLMLTFLLPVSRPSLIPRPPTPSPFYQRSALSTPPLSITPYTHPVQRKGITESRKHTHPFIPDQIIVINSALSTVHCLSSALIQPNYPTVMSTYSSSSSDDARYYDSQLPWDPNSIRRNAKRQRLAAAAATTIRVRAIIAPTPALPNVDPILPQDMTTLTLALANMETSLPPVTSLYLEYSPVDPLGNWSM